MGTLFSKIRRTSFTALWVCCAGTAFAGPTKECDVRIRHKGVARLAVPIGAATTLKLPEDFDFAISGNSRDFKTASTPQPRFAVVQAASTSAKETSLTVVMKSGTQISLWLVPTSKTQGCVLANIRRGL